MMPQHRERARQEQEVYDLIVNEFIPKVRFTADDVYRHKSGPADLDMYAALDQLVFEKKLQKVDRLFDESWHDKMVYAVAGEDGYRPCHCRDCFELTIGPPGEMCDHCEASQCEPDSECQWEGAYGAELDEQLDRNLP